MAPGNYFVEWLDQWIARSPLARSCNKENLTFGDLRRDDLPAGISDTLRDRATYRLQVIASDVSGGRMLVLPQDIERYRRKDGSPYDADSLGISEAVRMSMSYPYLSAPVALYDEDGAPHYIVDGGLLSNFPVWLFDTSAERPASRPTWGFRLHGGATDLPKDPYVAITMPFWRHKLAMAMFQAATQAWDARHAMSSTVVRTIDIGTRDVSTTDFNLSPETARALFDWGVEAAERFFNRDETRDYVIRFAADGGGGRFPSAPASVSQ